MKPIELSPDTIEAVKPLYRIYKEGRLFAQDYSVNRTCEVYEAANLAADAIAKDIARHASKVMGDEIGRYSGEDYVGFNEYKILYNLKEYIHVRVSPYYCAEGVYDYDTGECYYNGIVRC